LLLDLPKVEWMHGFSPNMSSLPASFNQSWVINERNAMATGGCDERTQNCHHYIILENLYRAAGNEVKARQHIALVNQCVSGWSVRGFEFEGESSQASRRCTIKGGTACQQVSIEMKTNISLQTFWESFQHRVHVNAVGVCPGMLEILFQSLTQWVWNLIEKFREFFP
jgi:hypothetical protein